VFGTAAQTENSRSDDASRTASFASPHPSSRAGSLPENISDLQNLVSFRMYNTSMLAPQASLETPDAAQLPSALAQGTALTQPPMAFYRPVHLHVLCPQLVFTPKKPPAADGGAADVGNPVFSAAGGISAGRSAQAEVKPEQTMAFQVSPYYYAYRGCRCTEGRVSLRPPPSAHRHPFCCCSKPFQAPHPHARHLQLGICCSKAPFDRSSQRHASPCAAAA
jgi:hypothetical protein